MVGSSFNFQCRRMLRAIISCCCKLEDSCKGGMYRIKDVQKYQMMRDKDPLT